MGFMGTGDPQVDWYRTTLSGDTRGLFWEECAEEKVARALAILGPTGRERVLDLACTTGQRTLELSRRGFCVVGTDTDNDLMVVGACEAEWEDLYPLFVESDPRDLEFLREFDLVLSLAGGAFGYFDDPSDDRLLFQRVSRSLRPGGRLLMQTPNVVYLEAHLPDKAWLEGENVSLLIEQTWQRERRRIEGATMSLIEGEAFEGFDPEPFARRVYTVEELAETFESVGMELVNVFDENGDPCAPTEDQQEIFVEARF